MANRSPLVLVDWSWVEIMVQAALVSIVQQLFPVAHAWARASVVCVVVVLGDCADQKLQQAAAFADTVIVFEDSLPAVVDRALAVPLPCAGCGRCAGRSR